LRLEGSFNPPLRAYLCGAYLFSVPVFSYSEALGLMFIPQILGAILVAFALLDVVSGLRITVPLEIGLYGLLGLWAGITYYLIGNVSAAGNLSLGSLLKVSAATLACAQLIKNENDFFIALRVFTWSILAVYYLNREDLNYLRFAGKFTADGRFAGTFANANVAAIFALTVIWSSILLLAHSHKRSMQNAVYGIPIGVSLLIIYYSGSKKGLFGLGLFVIFATRLLKSRQNRTVFQKVFPIALSIMLILFVGYFIYTSPYFFRIQQLSAGGDEGDVIRFQLFKEALSTWLMNERTFVMGVGHDNFRNFSAYQDYSHSTPFELLASNGIVGFVLFLGFLGLLFRRFIRLYKIDFECKYKNLYFAIVSYLFIFSIFLVGAILHESRELIPILGCVSAFGQYRLNRIEGLIRTRPR